MIEFNRAVLAGWILSGVKFVEYTAHREEGFSVLAPAPGMDYENEKSYVLPVGSDEILEMANGDPLGVFKFYIRECVTIKQ